MKFLWVLLFWMIVILCMEGTESCSYPTTCTASQKRYHKWTVACGWMWQKRCTKSTKYYVHQTYYTCYKYKPCPVHGKWSEWSWNSWIQCVAVYGHNCIGEQVRKRQRTCSKPKHGGRHCSGPSKQVESRLCLMKVDGGWSSWGKWLEFSPCLGNCEKGAKLVIRTRSCIKPKPRCGGSLCHGSSFEHKMKACFNKISCVKKKFLNQTNVTSTNSSRNVTET